MHQDPSPHFTNLEVVDQAGHKIGTVSDVVSDVATLEPVWLIVDVGLTKSRHYLPADAVHQTADGHLVIPFDKDTVKTAVKPNKGHVLSSEDERDLREHYRRALN